VENTRLETLLAAEPVFARWLLASLATQLSTALNRIETHMSLSAETRLARFLTDPTERVGLNVKITQQELADFIGVSRITIGQLVKRLTAMGALKSGYRAMTVINPETLRRLCAYA
jgi:CRP/FNR family transcriptional regulator, cyclic AMP receptor protein